jgi:hypothetical protein
LAPTLRGEKYKQEQWKKKSLLQAHRFKISI